MIVLAIIVFGFIGYKTDWNKTMQSIKDANYMMIGLGSIIMLGAHFLRAYRWSMLTETANFKLNHRRTFYSVMAGYLVNAATSRGGEVVRCALTTKSEKVPLEILIGTVITERIVDLIFMVLLAILCLFVQFDQFFVFANQYVFTPVINNLFSGQLFQINLDRQRVQSSVRRSAHLDVLDDHLVHHGTSI